MIGTKTLVGLLSAVVTATLASIFLEVPSADAAFPGSSGNIVFQRNGDIWLTGPGIRSKLTPGTPSFVDVDPAVSPNGRKVAFTSNRDGDFEIFTVDLYTGVLTKVTRNGVRDAEPAWAPDGTSLVYESPTTASGRSDTDLWTKSADGTGIATDAVPEPGDSRAPSWSPDGQEIAYDESGKVLVKKLSTGSIRPISNDPCFTSIKPNWSPDGSRLVFQANQGTGCSTDDYEIFSARSSDGGDLLQITNNSTPDGNPAYSPDGVAIVYGNFAPGNGDILLTAASGIFLPEPVVVEPTDDGSPDWGVAARPAAPGCTISGTFAGDQIMGDSLNDTICALGGNDRIFGYRGNDTLKGATGRDKLAGEAGRDTHLGGSGNDLLDSQDSVNGNDTLNGGSGADTCIKDRREASVRNCP
jgi:TolB protein